MLRKRNFKMLACFTLGLTLIVGSVGCSSGADTAAPAASAEQVKKTTEPKAEFKPTKPVTMVVPFAAGGATDLTARAIEKVWNKYVPVPLTVLNKTAGGGIEGATFTARSDPDGYTLVIGYGSGHDLVMPHIQKVEYNPFNDLEPISRISIHSVAVLVPENSPFNKIKDIVDWSKAENKPVTASVSAAAGSVDIVMRGIGKATGINVTPVPHSGGAQSITTLIGGNTVMGGGHPSEIVSPLQSKRIRAIAIATPERDPLFPELPTLIEEGINFSTWGSVKGIATAKNTPKEIIDYYADLFKKISEDQDFKKAMGDMLQPIQYQGPEEFAKFFKQAYDDYGKLVKELGLEQAK